MSLFTNKEYYYINIEVTFQYDMKLLGSASSLSWKRRKNIMIKVDLLNSESDSQDKLSSLTDENTRNFIRS